MDETGVRNGAHGADKFGFTGSQSGPLEPDRARALRACASRRAKLRSCEGGALCARDRRAYRPQPQGQVRRLRRRHREDGWWEKNGKLTPEQFDLLLDDFLAHAKGKELFAQDLYGGADPKYRIKARVFTELAWHSLFIRSLLIRPDRSELANYVPDFTILCLPSVQGRPKRHGVRSETVIAINFTKRMILIGGSYYAGEMKKSVFTTLNYYLPAESVMPMHCSANVGPGGDVALFFGLSGTGKTTLSADPNRTLIGDDEHGWGPHGVFNFEGGCYAKCIKLSAEAEPEIYAATLRFGTVLENVVFDPVTRVCDFDDESKTENTRSAYPLEFIRNASRTGRAGQPKNLVMLTADAFGVMPPIAKLTPAQAMYHFLSGYTAKVAGTEKGLVGVEPGVLHLLRRAVPAAPPVGLRQPAARADLGARRRLLAGQHRLDRRQVRRRATHADQGDAHAADRRARRLAQGRKFRTDPYFGFSVPTQLAGVEPHLLYPFKTWQNKAEFDETARNLVSMFQENFVKFETHVDADVKAAAAPRSVSPPNRSQHASNTERAAGRPLFSSVMDRIGGTFPVSFQSYCGFIENFNNFAPVMCVR